METAPASAPPSFEGSPSRLIPEARDPAVFARHAAALALVESRARAEAASPIPPLPWSLFRLYADTGNRYLYEAAYFERRKRLSDLLVSVLAGRDSDGSLLAALQDMLWAICDEYTWALPAHLTESSHEGGRPDAVTLDLFASETGFYLAETLHCLGDAIDPRVAARVRAELRRRITDSFLGPYIDPWWTDGHNNWSAVCGGAIGAVFLYEERDPARRDAALARILDVFDRYLATFPDDGICEEGTGYWSYGFGYYVVFADLLRAYTAGAVDLFAKPKVAAIACYPQRAQLTADRTVSFSDGGRFNTPARFILERLHACFPGVFLPGGPIPGAPCQKPGHLLREFAWCDPARPAAIPADGVDFLAGQQWLVARQSPFAFAALFGNNGVSHNHNDVGSFLMVYDGVEGPMDLGPGEYTRQYFGPERYSILCCGSQGHSVPIVGGGFQKHGSERRAAGVEFTPEKDGVATFSGDIAPAYAIDGLDSLRRVFGVARAEARVTVSDTFVFGGAPLPVTERFVGYERPEPLAPGRVRFGAFIAEFDPALEPKVEALSSVSYGSPENRLAKKTDVFALDFELPPGATSFAISFGAAARRTEGAAPHGGRQ